MNTTYLRLTLAVLLFIACLPAWSLPTGYRDDFTGALNKGWQPTASYHLSQADGQLTMKVGKQTKWEGQTFVLDGPHDFSANPYLNLQVKTDTPCILHVYFCDDKGYDLIPLYLDQSSDFVTLSYDFSKEKVDLTHITKIILAVNGNADHLSGALTLKDLRMGDQATPLANFAALDDLVFFHDSGHHAVRIMGLRHTTGFTLSGTEKLLQHITFSPIENDRCTMSFDCVPGASGAVKATLTAQGDGIFQANQQTVPVVVEDNAPPTIDAGTPMTVQVGKDFTQRFTGVSDGNSAAEQAITFSVQSSHPRMVAEKDVTFDYFTGGRYATMHVRAGSVGDTQLTITLDNHGGGKSTTQTTVTVQAVKAWNHLPTLDPIADLLEITGDAEQRIPLTGIGDGDNGKQRLSFSAKSSDETIVPAPTIEYHHGTEGVLRFTPTNKPGKATITVIVMDNGGTKDNNGNQQTQQTFTIVTRVRPLTAFTETFATDAAMKTLRPEDAITIERTTQDDKPTLAIHCAKKFTYAGVWMTVPSLDVSKTPYLSVDVKCDDPLQFNVYFWDGTSRRNDAANRITTLKAGEWQTITFDFTGKGQLDDYKGNPIDTRWVTQLLFNFHPHISWPFDAYSGNLYFRNLRVGTAADIPPSVPTCSLNPLPEQVHLRNAGMQHLLLSGVGCSNNATVTLTARTTGSAGLTDISIAPLKADGSAMLSYRVSAKGRDTVQVNVSAAGATEKTVAFAVDVLDDEATQVTIDPVKHFQTIRGFGTMLEDLPTSVYVGDLGVSACRLGAEMQEFEPRRDNYDPNVINPAAYNPAALNWANVRAAKKAGVETYFVSCWSPPAWMKPNRSSNYLQGGYTNNSDATDNRLDYDEYENFAKMLVQLVRVAKEEGGIDLTAISLQNEPEFHEMYGSAILDPAHMVQLIKVVGRCFAREGIKTKLMMPEQVMFAAWMDEYINPLNADAEAQQYCPYVATHGYNENGTKSSTIAFDIWSHVWDSVQKGAGKKELWQSETSAVYGPDWKDNFQWAIELYGALEVGNVSLYMTFDPEGQQFTHGKPNPMFYIFRQYWKFIRPGAMRVATTTLKSQVLVTTFINDQQHGGKLVSVLVNRSDKAQAVSLTITGHPVKSWQVVCTDPIRCGNAPADVAGNQLLLLPPSSITTVIEK